MIEVEEVDKKWAKDADKAVADAARQVQYAQLWRQNFVNYLFDRYAVTQDGFTFDINVGAFVEKKSAG
jgi:hypothetical protein